MAVDVKHLSMAELEAGLEVIRQSPTSKGVLKWIVRRPQVDEREVLLEGELDLAEGLVGDNWKDRPRADPEMQLNVMNSRAIALIAQDKSRWQLAGDQLFIDMDLSAANLPPGTQLAVGNAVIEVTEPPHTGCKKFVLRYGLDAMKFVNSEIGRELNLRGINAKIIQPGVIRVNDVVEKLC